MSAAAVRLRGRRRFSAVRGLRAHCRVSSVRVWAAPSDLDQARVGFAVVGLRRAVDRNRVRRRLRAAVTEPLHVHPHTDFVVSAGVEVLHLPYAALLAAVQTATATAAQQAHRRMSGA